MKSQILSSYGLGEIDAFYLFLGGYIATLIVLIILIVQIVQLNSLKKKYKKFMTGKNAGNLEKDIMRLYEEHEEMKESLDTNKKDIRKIFRTLESTFQKIGIVKYDAFQQMGGKLSFSLAMLDEKNNGFILNSVHSTDGCYCYTKDIKNGMCNLDLGMEEKEALEIAMGEDE